MAFLKVFTNGEERTVFLGDDPVVVGRGMETDVLLKDRKSSREHCVIERRADGRWRVLDLQSGNGTKVNGYAIESHVLEPDDVITVGDARILFAGEAVAVVGAESPVRTEDAAPERPRRAQRRKSHASFFVMAAVLLVALATLLFVWNRGGGDQPRFGAREAAAYRAVKSAEGDADLVELARTYLDSYRGSPNTAAVERLVSDARDRLRRGASRNGYDPRNEVKELKTRLAIEKLQRLLTASSPEKGPAIRTVLAEYQERLHRERAAFFKDLEAVFSEYVVKGEFSRAREIWFFLRGDEDWIPIPTSYINRIVQKNRELETSAAAARTRLFENVTRAEAAHDFERARALLKKELPRFKGTAVARSLAERLDFVNRALREGVPGAPTMAPTTVAVNVEKRMEALLAGLAKREFRGTADGLRQLAKEAGKVRGAAEIAARANECFAAATLHDAMTGDLAAGKFPKRLIAKRWRVVKGGASGVTVRSKGKELTYSWAEAPAELYTALAERHANKTPLGYCVVAFAVGGDKSLAAALDLTLKNERTRSAIDAFIASRVKREKVPKGGYVLYAGEIVSRKEFHRREEEALIQRFTAQFKKAHAAILADTTAKKLDKLKKKKDKLDEARTFAKELIYDSKKYFYPYRGSGRMGEYNKVQQEVDRRVAAVRDLWERLGLKSVKASPEMQKALKLFDEAAKELEKRLVYVEEEVDDVAFLRSYFGQKFTIRSFYRTPEEKDLLDYTVEVMAYNVKVEGDITEVEREQVRVTNDYRIMFGHQPVRIVEKLVKSSRGHCEEMSRLGYFGHFSPTPGRRTPYDRMRLEGYMSGSSENCIMGQTSPMGSHNGWCHSSGHHRNLLMPAWTEMGTGHYGRYMTQNFGSASKYSENDKKESNDDAMDAEPGGGGDGFDYDDED